MGFGLGFGFWACHPCFFLGVDALFQRKFEDLQLRFLSPCKHREIETEIGRFEFPLAGSC